MPQSTEQPTKSVALDPTNIDAIWGVVGKSFWDGKKRVSNMDEAKSMSIYVHQRNAWVIDECQALLVARARALGFQGEVQPATSTDKNYGIFIGRFAQADGVTAVLTKA